MIKPIEKKKMKKFKDYVDIILNELKGKGIEPILRWDSTIPDKTCGNSMSISYKFNKGGLKYWYLGIWGCGKWSDTYDSDKKDYISVFLIHKWYYDRFRPSCCDIEFQISLENTDKESIKTYIKRTVITGIDNINENPIQSYYNIFLKDKEYKDDHTTPCIEYFRDWWDNEIVCKFKTKLKYKWSVKFLYGILKAISFIDPRVNRGILFIEDDTIPTYTSGFLATEWTSDHDRAFNSFAWLYSKFPSWLRDKTKWELFNAYWNVADFPAEMTNELERRMKRGVVI